MFHRIGTYAKYIDQQLVVKKLSNSVPALLSGGAIAFGVHDTLRAPQEQRKKRGIKNFCVLSATVAASIVSARGLKIGKKLVKEGLIKNINKEKVLNRNKALIKRFYNILSKNIKIDNETKALTQNTEVKQILNNATQRHLHLDEIKKLEENFQGKPVAQNLLKKLTGKQPNLNSKKIIGEIGNLSKLGAIPIIGGVFGGLIGDEIAKDSCPRKRVNKIKEGFYQFFANIFLCNVGAGIALMGLEKLSKSGVISKPTPALKAGSMAGGILLTGVFGGSYIANWLGKKTLDPILEKCGKLKKNHKEKGIKSIYDERHPETIDIAMHADDFATTGLLSGLKWIEPVLPLLYFISGYRAGIGYRNGIQSNSDKISFNNAHQSKNPNKLHLHQKQQLEGFEMFNSFLK